MATSKMRYCIFRQWEKFWDLESPILIEKSPPTLMQLGYREALFPAVSSNLISVRHPLYGCFWRKIQQKGLGLGNLGSKKRRSKKRRSEIQEDLRSALDGWLKVHQYLIDESLPNLKDYTSTAIIMSEVFLSKKQAVQDILSFQQLFFPERFSNSSSALLRKEHRQLMFRGSISNNVIDEFDPTKINEWMEDWNKSLINNQDSFKSHILPIIEKYEEKFNRFGYSLVNVSQFDQKVFDRAFSLDYNHVYAKTENTL